MGVSDGPTGWLTVHRRWFSSNMGRGVNKLLGVTLTWASSPIPNLPTRGNRTNASRRAPFV